jgi:diguanylate cyclase (GGDEF)-like protein
MGTALASGGEGTLEYWTRVLENVSLVEFVLLAVVTCVQWLRHRIHVGWAALTFGLLGGISLLTRVDPSLLTNEAAVKTLIAMLVLVPYCLFRFATSFRDASPVVDFVALALTVCVIATTLALQHRPVPGLPSPLTRAFSPSHLLAYEMAFVAPFAFLSGFVATRLFRASGGQPPVAAYRMRLSAVAVAGLGVCFVVSVLGVSAFGLNGVRTALAGQALLVAVGALFLVALALPSLVRVFFRHRKDRAYHRTVSELVAAKGPVDLAERLLPRVGALAGAPTAVLVDRDGAVVARYQAPGPEQQELWESPAADVDDADRIVMRTNSGTRHELVVLVDPYLRYFGTEELHELEQLAGMAGLAMERCEMTEQVAFQASHDGLTGLANRALFVERLRAALSHVGRGHLALAVLFIDLDRFKRVNDEVDHAAGDVVLSAIAERLTVLTRGVDLAARFGGDEFVVFAEVDHEQDAVDIAERIRVGLGAPIAVSNTLVSVTASIGVVVTADGSTTPAALLHEADHAMYGAKRAGCNTVVVHRARARDVAARRWGLDDPETAWVSAG